MTKTLGMKFDSDKPRLGLLPPIALESIADVLTFGAKKYAPDNWRYVDNANSRYIDAALRHITAYMRGEYTDQETDLPHLSHAACCLMFIIELDKINNENYYEDDLDELMEELVKESKEDIWKTIVLDIISAQHRNSKEQK